MLDDFFTRALIAGIGVALVAGPLGCLIIWRRLSYYGDTLSHSALLGVALALVFQINIMLAVFCVCALVSLMVLLLQRRTLLPSDAILGLLSHSTLALGLVCLSLMSWIRVDLMALLFGDILAVSRFDLMLIFTGGVGVLGVLMVIWRPLFAATVNSELAHAEGLDPRRHTVVFMLLMATVIAISMKIVGVLLITALLIIPATAARRFSTGPEQMAILAGVAGVTAVIAGLFGSLAWDTPAGPSIVVAAAAIFLATQVLAACLGRAR